jgi:hypothetical protein
MNQAMFDLIKRVEKFMMKVRYEHSQKTHGRDLSPIPYDSMAYGEALFHWQQNGRGANSYFSTEDPSVLELAAELRQEFGLEIVTREEGLAREAALKAKRKISTGFGWMN